MLEFDKTLCHYRLYWMTGWKSWSISLICLVQNNSSLIAGWGLIYKIFIHLHFVCEPRHDKLLWVSVMTVFRQQPWHDIMTSSADCMTPRPRPRVLRFVALEVICNARQSNKFYDSSGSGVQLRGDNFQTRAFLVSLKYFQVATFCKMTPCVSPCLSSQSLCFSGRGSRKLVRGLLKFNLDPCLNLASSFCLGPGWQGLTSSHLAIVTPDTSDTWGQHLPIYCDI